MDDATPGKIQDRREIARRLEVKGAASAPSGGPSPPEVLRRHDLACMACLTGARCLRGIRLASAAQRYFDGEPT